MKNWPKHELLDGYIWWTGGTGTGEYDGTLDDGFDLEYGGYALFFTANISLLNFSTRGVMSCCHHLYLFLANHYLVW